MKIHQLRFVAAAWALALCGHAAAEVKEVRMVGWTQPITGYGRLLREMTGTKAKS